MRVSYTPSGSPSQTPAAPSVESTVANLSDSGDSALWGGAAHQGALFEPANHALLDEPGSMLVANRHGVSTR